MSKPVSKKDKSFGGQERRKSARRPIVDSFSIFVVIPKKGGHRLPIRDLSEGGVGFDLDTEGEIFEYFPVKVDETLELHLYLNQTLYIPLKGRVAQMKVQDQTRKMGLEIKEAGQEGSYRALKAFVQMLDQIIDAAHFA